MVLHCLYSGFLHLIQFVRFLHLDMFGCYLFIFTADLNYHLGISLVIHFPGDEHMGYFHFYFTITNHAIMNSCACLWEHIKFLWGTNLPVGLLGLSRYHHLYEIMLNCFPVQLYQLTLLAYKSSHCSTSLPILEMVWLYNGQSCGCTTASLRGFNLFSPDY